MLIDTLLPSRSIPQYPLVSYSLSITRDAVTVPAREARGLFYGAISLWQLVTAIRRPPARGDRALPAMSITDARASRGEDLMLDVASALHAI